MLKPVPYARMDDIRSRRETGKASPLGHSLHAAEGGLPVHGREWHGSIRQTRPFPYGTRDASCIRSIQCRGALRCGTGLLRFSCGAAYATRGDEAWRKRRVRWLPRKASGADGCRIAPGAVSGRVGTAARALPEEGCHTAIFCPGKGGPSWERGGRAPANGTVTD